MTKDCWAVLRADRSLVLFPVLAFLFSAIAFVLLLAPGIGLAAAADKEWPAVSPCSWSAGSRPSR